MGHKAHGPEVQVALATLEKQSLNGAKGIIEKMPMWRDAMGASSLEPVLQSLSTVLESEATKLKSKHGSKVAALTEHEKSELQRLV